MTRKTLAVSAAVAAALLAPALPASAAPTGGTSALDTVAALQQQGYDVALNGIADVPLSECIVTDVHGLSDVRPTTAYVDISCPSDN